MDSPRDMVPPGRGSRCPALRRLVPVGFGAEARTLIVLSGPLFLFQMLNFMIYVVSSVFCGHLGKVELAAVTLSVAFVNVCGVSIGFGLSSACDTLMSQSFGSPNRKHVGVILQRGALVLLLCCFPCWALFLNTQHILLLCRQDPAVSRLAQEYVHVYIPALPPAGQISAKPGHHVAPSPQRRRGQLRQRAGQLRPGFRAGPGGQVSTGAGGPASGGRGQLRQRAGQLRPGFRAGPGGQVSTGAGGPASGGRGQLHQRVGQLRPGFRAGPGGQVSTGAGGPASGGRGQLHQRVGQLRPGFRAGPGGQFTQAVFLLLCVVKKKLHLDTWAGWSSQCLQGWGPFFRLAVPSMLMTCIEWWAYEIGSFLMGRLSVLDLSAQAIIYEVATVVYMIPMGLSIAVCFRVGTALGAADTVQAKRSAVSGTLCTVGTSLVVGTLLGLLRNKLGHIFTNDEEVVALVGKVLPLYVIFHLFEAVCCLYGGVLRGTGRQAFGAVVNAVTYYVVGLPLGVVLTFVVGLGITGLWLGMLACVFLAAAAFVTYTACMDWKRAAEEWSGACEVCLCVTTSCSACRAQLRPGWTAGRPDNSVSFRCRNVWGCRPRPLRAQPPASDPGLRERSYLQKGFAELCAISSCQVFSGRELPPVTDNRETTQKIKTQSW
ncbi:multidrug and toxin extrusion protein 2-like isoform X2 [Neophocaena asiaeorientalis asiaeorientalis]|uniref:Multidrug and toxin extrusion protein n=1 Tax=Neophocaena asiaeorientalis asiaeorientalis TaxID=1706337 RepID=A0A341C045_NEOAA|nr:multidrug and toxin extrusion protein 2-like isoform X2 [Neophocaena asiaeorientalis asiaeorientalis]